MASHDFQTALQNYLDLEDMRKKLVAWQTSLDSFDDLVRLRRQYYEPLLPEIDGQFRKLDAQMRLRLEQRKHLEQTPPAPADRPEAGLPGDRGRAVVGSADRSVGGRAAATPPIPSAAALRLRIRRLKGVLTWTQETEYHQRLTDAHAHLRELDGDVDALTAQYDAFVRTRQAATHSYVGYETPIDSLRTRIGACARAPRRR